MNEEERFKVVDWKLLKGTPWCMRPRERQRLAVAEDEAPAPGVASEHVEEIQPRSLMRRRLFVMQAEIERFGPTDGCFRCEAILQGASVSARGPSAGARARASLSLRDRP